MVLISSNVRNHYIVKNKWEKGDKTNVHIYNNVHNTNTTITAAL